MEIDNEVCLELHQRGMSVGLNSDVETAALS